MAEDTELNLLLWAIRAFAVVAILGVVVLLGFVWWWIVRPVITEGQRAREAGDWWLPFLPCDDGSFGPLADNHWWSAMRANTPGSAAGLSLRWGFWLLMSIALTIGMIRGLYQLAQLATRAFN